MTESQPSLDTPWMRLDAASVADLLADTEARWWLSGGSAYDQWRGEPLRARDRTTISTVYTQLDDLVGSLPGGMSCWARIGDDLVLEVDRKIDEAAAHATTPPSVSANQSAMQSRP